LLCIGLDPDIKRIPDKIRSEQHPIFTFNKAIIEATQDLTCCYKPQIAHYAAAGAESELEMTIEFINGADAVTINPYLGLDSMTPYLDHADKGVFILCRTSNPGGGELQNLTLENGSRLFEHVAQEACTTWNYNGNVGLVVGATRPNELQRIREIVGKTTLLLPGVGSQGADVSQMMSAGAGGGMLVSASRSIIFASEGQDFANAAREAALATRDEINQYRQAA